MTNLGIVLFSHPSVSHALPMLTLVRRWQTCAARLSVNAPYSAIIDALRKLAANPRTG